VRKHPNLTPEEQFAEWAAEPLTTERRAIFCGDWHPLTEGLKANCEVCGRAICAYPVSIEAAKRPDVHLLCRTNCMPRLVSMASRAGQSMKLGGRIRDNKAPWAEGE
jgi:hypothetical protein